MMWVRDSLVTRARNKLVTQFLESDYTHLFFVDADISFTPDDFIRIVNVNKPIVTAPYPIKKKMGRLKMEMLVWVGVLIFL